MFFDGNIFWLLNGVILTVVALWFKDFAEGKGWAMTWWKWLLTGIWYLIFTTSFYAWGTLIGENFPGAGFKFFLLGFFVSLILGVGLWRLLAAGSKKA
jgi:hypothetical protein